MRKTYERKSVKSRANNLLDMAREVNCAKDEARPPTSRVHVSFAECARHGMDRLREWCRDSLIGKREGFITSNIWLRETKVQQNNAEQNNNSFERVFLQYSFDRKSRHVASLLRHCAAASLLAREVSRARRSFVILIAFISYLHSTADAGRIGSGMSGVVTLIGKRESYTNLTFDHQIIKIWHAHVDSSFGRVFFDTRSKIKSVAAPPRRFWRVKLTARETKLLRHVNNRSFYVYRTLRAAPGRVASWVV